MQSKNNENTCAPLCTHCDQPATKLCPFPCNAPYCSKECQYADRKVHKKMCKGRSKRSPMQALILDIPKQALATQLLNRRDRPKQSTLACVLVPTLDIGTSGRPAHRATSSAWRRAPRVTMR